MPTRKADWVPEGRHGDAVLIVPPFADVDCPSLALHLLQACAATKNMAVDVIYANIAFAHLIGIGLYRSICYASAGNLLGERVFSHVAFGNRSNYSPIPTAFRGRGLGDPFSQFGVSLEELQNRATEFVGLLAGTLAERKTKICGCSSSFEQTAASVAILQALKTPITWNHDLARWAEL